MNTTPKFVTRSVANKEVAMTTTQPPALPAGATAEPNEWLEGRAQPYRIIYARDRRITDHRRALSPSALQWDDGTIDGGNVEPPGIYVYGLDESAPLKSDQARELATALLETADEIDGWVR
jgi:hypothetical protein